MRKKTLTSGANTIYKFTGIYDKAGNLYYINSDGNKVDTKEQAAQYIFGNWTKNYVRLFATGEDKESGLTDNSEVFIKPGSTTGINNQNAWNLCSAVIPRTYTVQAQGSSDLKFRNTDKVGNKKESNYVNVKLDRTGPTYTIGNTTDNSGNIILTATNIRDSYSRVKEYAQGIKCQYQKYTTSWSSWTNCASSNSVKITSSAVSLVKFRVRDKAGNVTEKIEEVTIDDQAPILTVTAGRCENSSSTSTCSSGFKTATNSTTQAQGNVKEINLTTWDLSGLKIDYKVDKDNLASFTWKWNISGTFDIINTILPENNVNNLSKQGSIGMIASGKRYGEITATDTNGRTSKVKITVYISKKVTVTYNKNSGEENPATRSEEFIYGKSNQAFSKSFTRQGYTLEGWSETSRGPKQYNVKENVTNNWVLENSPTITLYAVWRPNVCTITYNSNEGVFNNNRDNTVQKCNYSQNGNCTDNMRNATKEYYNATRDNYDVVYKKEWYKAGNKNKTYNQDNAYKATDFCPDLKNGDQNVTLKVNWEKVPSNPCNKGDQIGEKFFGSSPSVKEKDAPSGNVGNKRTDVANWGAWCYYSWQDGPYQKNVGYYRICYKDACGPYKGMTAEQFNEKTGCNMYKAWCFK